MHILVKDTVLFMPGDILDGFGIHAQNDAIGDESFPGCMVGDQFPFWLWMLLVLATGIVNIVNPCINLCFFAAQSLMWSFNFCEESFGCGVISKCSHLARMAWANWFNGITLIKWWFEKINHFLYSRCDAGGEDVSIRVSSGFPEDLFWLLARRVK